MINIFLIHNQKKPIIFINEPEVDFKTKILKCRYFYLLLSIIQCLFSNVSKPELTH